MMLKTIFSAISPRIVPNLFPKSFLSSNQKYGVSFMAIANAFISTINIPLLWGNSMMAVILNGFLSVMFVTLFSNVHPNL